MPAAAAQEPSTPFRECALRAVVLTPQRPIANWLVALDGSVREHQEKLLGSAVLLNVSALQPRKAELRALLARLDTRNIRIMAVEGAEPALLGPGLPPVLNSGAHAEIAEQASAGPQAGAPASQIPVRVVEGAVRSGQSVVFSEGDLTIVGSVSSGAEVVAGGSIHIYGALRGRAVAGAKGNSQARIFCRELAAELLAIDGYYRTADDIGPELLGRATHAWLEGRAVRVARQG